MEKRLIYDYGTYTMGDFGDCYKVYGCWYKTPDPVAILGKNGEILELDGEEIAEEFAEAVEFFEKIISRIS